MTLLLLDIGAAASGSCEKDTQENCNIISCGSSLHAQCVKIGSKNECYCNDGECTKSRGDGSNDLVCKPSSKCVAYSLCAMLEGDCCPTSYGTMLECCKGSETELSGAHSLSTASLALLLGVAILLLDAGVVASDGCAKDTQENCNLLSCGSSLNAKCVKVGNKNECYCNDGDCAESEGDGSNDLVCKPSSKCSAYSQCAMLEGDCCPTSNGTMLECCKGPETELSGAHSLSALKFGLLLCVTAIVYSMW